MIATGATGSAPPTPITPLEAFLRRHSDTRYLDAILCDLSCVMRGKRYPIAMADKVFTGGMMLPGSSFLLAVTGDSLDPEGMGFSDGDPDEVAMPIDGTLVPVPWNRHPTAQVMLTLQSPDGEPYYFDPRNVLARVVERFHELNLRPVVAFELEFYLLDPAHDNGRCLRPPPSGARGQRSDATQVYSIDQVEDFSHYLHEVTEACAQQGVTCGAISAEYAPGQFEINLHHSDNPLAAADQCVMFRRVVRGVARKHELQGTFMAKPHTAGAGSGLHLHISLRNEHGENAFAGDPEAGFATPACASPLLLHAIGGLRETMAEAMAIFAPNINSHRRFVPNSYVPVRPNWGYENRSVALRMPRAFELEFYLLNPAHDNGRCLRPPPSGARGQRSDATQVYSIDQVEDFSHYLHEVTEACAQQGVTCGAISAEYAPGQFEINLHHSDNPLAAADQCVMFRRVVRGVARKHELQGTFMAKPHTAGAGSGLHLHISLRNEHGENAFAGDPEAGFATPACASPLLLHAIGGLRETMAEAMAIFAPNINSHRRFVPNSYVPVRPNWGYENRSVALRVPKSPGHARRIEHRVSGADANPYLTLAALLAGIHHGITNRIDAGQPARGNAGQTPHPELPFDPPSALEKCRHGKILPAYLGHRYLNAYCSCKLSEYHAFVKHDQAEAGWYL